MTSTDSDDAAGAAWPEVPTAERTETYQGVLSRFLADILANGPARLAGQALVLIDTGRPTMAARLLAGLEREVRVAMCLSFAEGYHAGLTRGEGDAVEAGPSKVEESR